MGNSTRLMPIGRLLNVVEAAGFKIEYHYDDLVFINNTSLLFRFDRENPDTIYLHFNVECENLARERLTKFFTQKAKAEKITIATSTFFQFEQADGKEEFNIIFKENPNSK
jgi:hypothetical protein